MGACLSAESGNTGAKRNREIEAQLQNDRKKLKDEVKILLLGPGESGKSTVFKQMKIISHLGHYPKEEVAQWRNIVYWNIVTQMKVLVSAVNKLNLDLGSKEAKDASERIADVAPEGEQWVKQTGEDVDLLWKSPGIQAAFQLKDAAFQLNDNVDYFFNQIDRINTDSYQPNIQDILRARVRSLGIEEASFNLDGMELKVIDVGGQRCERRKWIHCFDSVTAVLFCASLSEYDQMLREDPAQNRMKESLALFDEICNLSWFKDTAFILFLNKIDLVGEKMNKEDKLKILFPKYTGGKNPKAA